MLEQLSVPIAAWGVAAVLVAVAVTASLLAPTRRRHLLGVVGVWAIAVLGLGFAAVSTLSAWTVSETELRDATQRAADGVHDAPGVVSQQRLAALVGDELGRDVFARVAADDGDRQSYRVVLADGDDSPSVCVVVSRSAGTETSVESSVVSIDDGACD